MQSVTGWWEPARVSVAAQQTGWWEPGSSAADRCYFLLGSSDAFTYVVPNGPVVWISMIVSPLHSP